MQFLQTCSLCLAKASATSLLHIGLPSGSETSEWPCQQQASTALEVLVVPAEVMDLSQMPEHKVEQHKRLSPALDLLGWQDRMDDLRIKQIKAWAASDGHILWTLANFGWLDFVLNWIAAVNLAGIDHFFVATLDSR